MRAPTLAPSPFGIHRARARKVVAAVFVAGIALSGSSVAASVLELLPAEQGLIGALQSVAMVVGVLLVSQMAVVAVWFSRQERPRPLPRRAVLVAGLAGPAISTGALVLAVRGPVGGPAIFLQHVEWLYLGQALIGLQLFVGSLEPARRRRRIAAVETGVVLLLPVSLLLATGGAPALRSLQTALTVGGGATGLFVLVGGPLYLLGNLLVCRPPYHRIP